MDEKRMDRLEEHLGAVREDLGSFKVDTSRQFEALREELGSFKVETSRQFEEVRTEIRLTRVVQEGLDSKIQMVAEGVAGTNERLDQQQAELRKTYREISEMLRPVYEFLGPKYRDLDRRVEVLEERDQENQEFLQGLRKRFGTR